MDALELMAELSGESRADLTRDPRALAAGLHALGDELAGLLRDLVSPDPAVREAAAARRRELLARTSAAPPPVDVLREKLSAALDEALGRLKSDT